MKKITVLIGIVTFIILMTCNNSLTTSKDKEKENPDKPITKLIEGAEYN